jgi:pilus assembly protein CpaF
MGPDDAPPSPDEVGADAGGGTSDGLANDVEDDALAGTGDDVANVFGSRAASDEDAGPEAGFGADAEPGRAAASDGAGDVDRLAPTPASAAAAHALAHEPGPAPISLDTLMADASITAIVIGAGANAEVERGGKLESIGSIGDGNLVAEAVWQLANTAVPPPAADNPIVDVRLLDGTRVTALFPPVTPASVCAVIRRPTVVEVSLADIAGNGDVEKIIGGAVSSRRNLLVAGDAPALAAMTSALGSAFGADHHVVSIGAGARTRAHWTDLGATGDPASLVRAAVAFRADHLLVAEAGGAELPELLLAAAKGQNGVIASIAARSASEALERLRAFSIGALGPQAFAPMVASTIDLIVLVESSPAGGARVVEIAEPVNDASGLHLAQVARRPETDRASGNLEIAGVSERLAGAIATHAEGLPSHLVRR